MDTYSRAKKKNEIKCVCARDIKKWNEKSERVDDNYGTFIIVLDDLSFNGS
jgi:hypothetical protein